MTDCLIKFNVKIGTICYIIFLESCSYFISQLYMGTHNYIIKSFEGLNLYFLAIEYTCRDHLFTKSQKGLKLTKNT